MKVTSYFLLNSHKHSHKQHYTDKYELPKFLFLDKKEYIRKILATNKQ